MFFHRRIVVILFMTMLPFLQSCSKGESTPPPPEPTTDLKLTFINEGGNRLSGVLVYLYASQNDWVMETSPVKTMLTDANGEVTFSALTSSRYWWMGKKDCLNNSNTNTSTTTALPAKQTTSQIVIMQSTGTLRMVNNSSNPYRIWVNGVLFGDQQGGTTINYKYERVGSYTIRVLQLSGYAVSPTDKTYTGTLTCNGILNTSYP